MLGRAKAALAPARWPVRWRLAAVSAGLTFIILLVFATVVGALTEERLRSDFRDEVKANARQLALSIAVDDLGRPTVRSGTEGDLERMLFADPDVAVRIVDSAGETVAPRDASELPTFPPPIAGYEDHGDLAVATEHVPSTSTWLEDPRIFVQYARAHDELDATISRLWLFLVVGVGAGALLATLAGYWVAQRAMRPIAALTATASRIAATRDPSVTMPQPTADDEVAELARTLDSMLAELDAARAEAQHMVQAQREFVADASHELRTPLTSILANLELLQERLERRDDGEAEEMVDSALRSSQRMGRLVRDLLMLARADAGRAGERAPVDLTDVAAGAVAEVRPVAGGRRIELETSGPTLVDGNRDELHRVVLNLLDNAVRHTPDDTTVEVAVASEDGHVELTVADDGPGLPPGLEEQVFSRFVRGEGPADLVPDAGTGLGLAIVRAVTESHGGRVEAGRSVSGGARFSLLLPAGSAAPRGSSASSMV